MKAIIANPLVRSTIKLSDTHVPPINTRTKYADVTNLNRAKGSPEGRRPFGRVKGQRSLGSPNKHADTVCRCHQLNRAKGSREELPCRVKGQRPLGSPNKHADIVCSCHQLNRAKGSREELPCRVKGQRPLGSPNKHADIVCSCHQLNRAKGSREELPCGVKGQRPSGHLFIRPS